MAALGVIEHRIGTSVSWPYYVAIIIFFFLSSCFLAWRDEFRARADLEEQARPKLSIHFSGSALRPEVQDLGPSQNGETLQQRLFRVSVRNDSTVSVKAAQVVLEAVESDSPASFFPGHGLRVMGRQDHSPHFDIGPEATQWVDLVGYVLLSSGEHYYLAYAELGELEIPPGRHQLILRVDGCGLPARARVVVNCPRDGKFEVAEFIDASGKRRLTLHPADLPPKAAAGG